MSNRKIYISLAFNDKNELIDYVGDTSKAAALNWCKLQAESGHFTKMRCMEKGLFDMYWFKYELTSPF